MSDAEKNPEQVSSTRYLERDNRTAVIQVRIHNMNKSKSNSGISWFSTIFQDTSNSQHITMKVCLVLCGVLLAAVYSEAFPQKDGAIFSNEAIRQAQSTFLIPKNAEIQKVQEGIEVAAYENIGESQPIDLFQILGDQYPPEVVSNLQAQVEMIGKTQ